MTWLESKPLLKANSSVDLRRPPRNELIQKLTVRIFAKFGIAPPILCYFSEKYQMSYTIQTYLWFKVSSQSLRANWLRANIYLKVSPMSVLM